MFDHYPEVSITEEMEADWVSMRKTLDYYFAHHTITLGFTPTLDTKD